MLSNKTVIFLAILLVLTILGLRLSSSDIYGIHGSDAMPLRLFSNQTTQPIGLHIEKAGLSVGVERNGMKWHFDAPIVGLADASRIGLIVSTLESARVRDRITRRQREARGLSLGDYGLDSPQVRLRERFTGDRNVMIDFGNLTPAGEGIFVRINSTQDVYVIDNAILGLLPSSIDDLRDRVLFPDFGSDIVALEIRRPGIPTIRLESDANGLWHMKAPVQTDCNSPTVLTMIETLGNAVVENFVWTPTVDVLGGNSVASADLARRANGLSMDEICLSLSVWRADDEYPQEFIFGAKDPVNPATVMMSPVANASVCTVRRDVLDALSLPADILRERRVFPFDSADISRISIRSPNGPFSIEREEDGDWSIIEPASISSDSTTIKEFVENIIRIQDESVVTISDGFAIPIDAIKLEFDFIDKQDNKIFYLDATKAADGSSDSLQVDVIAKDTRLRHTISGNIAEVAQIISGAFSVFGSRTVFSIPQSDILSIFCRTADGSEWGTQRGQDGRWIALASDSRVSTKNDGLSFDADTIVAAISPLYAIAVAALDATDLEEYGLKEPRLEISVSTSSPDRPVVILLLGTELPDGSRYLRLKGERIVFVISKETADSLLLPTTHKNRLK